MLIKAKQNAMKLIINTKSPFIKKEKVAQLSGFFY